MPSRALLRCQLRRRFGAPRAGGPLETVHEDCGHGFHMVPTCSKCGGEVDSRNVHSHPGPGATDEQCRRAAKLRAERRAA